MQIRSQNIVELYVDGELKGQELESFLRELDNNPNLLESVEQEVLLNVAIVNDLSLIEPPSDIRERVLRYVSVNSAQQVSTNRYRWLIPVFLFVLCFLTVITNVNNPATVSVARRVLTHDKVGGSVYVVSEVQEEKKDIANGSVKLLGANKQNKMQMLGGEVEYNSAQVSPLPLQLVSTIQTRTLTKVIMPRSFFGSFNNIAFEQELLGGYFSGMCSPFGVVVRYNQGCVDSTHLFFEGGALQLQQSNTLFKNGVETRNLENSFVPYVGIGIQTPLLELPIINQQIHGSFSLGITSLGPVATSELSAQIFQIQQTSFDVGLCFIASSDLGNKGAIQSMLTPTIRFAIKLD